METNEEESNEENKKMKKTEEGEEEKSDEDMEKTEDEEDIEKSDDEDEVEKSEGMCSDCNEKTEECKCDNTEKDALGGSNPEEESAAGADSGNTTTSVPVINNRQHTLVPASSVPGSRNAPPGNFASGQSPNDVSYTGKSVKADLLKSPVFVGITKQLDNFQKAMNQKFAGIEKSFKARVANLEKGLKVLAEQPLYKSRSENLTEKPESFEKKIEEGKIKYQN